MNNFIKIMLFSLAAIVFSGASNAATFTGSTTVNSFCTESGHNICNGVWRENAGLLALTDSLDLTIATPVYATGDGVFKLTAWGDFDKASEYLTVHVESFVIGNFLNSNPDDDLFSDDGFQSGTRADRGSEYGQLQAGVCRAGECTFQPARIGTVTIPQLELNAILADGLFTAHLWLSKNVSDGPCCGALPIDEYVTAELWFPTAAITAIPAPPAALLFGSALALFGTYRRRARG
jgi:hypothetical protein